MDYRILGRTGIKVSEIGFGAWAIGGPATLGPVQVGWGKVDDATSIHALETAFDLGINFFDTADAYGAGHSEELIGQVFGQRREQIVISSKVGNRVTPESQWVKDFSPTWIREGLEGSLRRLQTDYIDVYHLHSPPADFEYSDEIIDTLEHLKQAGKIRFCGVSLTPPGRGIAPSQQGLDILKKGNCDFFQVEYNILQREEEEELFPACQKQEVGIIARVPLASGFLAGKFTADTRFGEDDHRRWAYPPDRASQTVEKVERLRFLTEGKDKTLAQAALQFCLSHPAVSVVIPGAKTPEQVRDNAAASDGVLLSEEELAKIRELVPEEPPA